MMAESADYSLDRIQSITAMNQPRDHSIDWSNFEIRPPAPDVQVGSMSSPAQREANSIDNNPQQPPHASLSVVGCCWLFIDGAGASPKASLFFTLDILSGCFWGAWIDRPRD